MSTLNCIIGFFDPFRSDEGLQRTAAGLARHLRLGAAMGAPRVLIWDGELDEIELLDRAPDRLALMIEQGRQLAGLASPPAVAVELHPNTFAFKYKLHEPVARALKRVGAGVCFDFCHAAVALGPDFSSGLSSSFVDAISHVHFADSDGMSEQLHFPPGQGCVDLEGAQARLAGSGLGVAWDLFSWQAPRHAIVNGMSRYLEAVRVIGGDRSTGDVRS